MYLAQNMTAIQSTDLEIKQMVKNKSVKTDIILFKIHSSKIAIYNKQLFLLLSI